MLGAPRRTADVLLALDHDPDLGYTSDPELTRALWWVVLPGAALLLALAGPVVGLVRGLVDRPTQALSLASAADSTVAWRPVPRPKVDQPGRRALTVAVRTSLRS
jgi:hypothetical protein